MATNQQDIASSQAPYAYDDPQSGTRKRVGDGVLTLKKKEGGDSSASQKGARSTQRRGFPPAQGSQRAGRAQADLEVPKKNLTGIVFWLVFLLALSKDFLIDIATNLTLLLAILSSIATFFIGSIIFLYLLYNGVFRLEKRFAQKLAIFLGTIIIEVIPFLNFLPTISLSLLIIRWIEHNTYAKEMIQYTSVREAILEKGGEVQKGLRERQARREREARRRERARRRAAEQPV